MSKIAVAKTNVEVVVAVHDNSDSSRECYASIWVSKDDSFNGFHVTNTFGSNLTFHRLQLGCHPRTTNMRLLSMELFAKISEEKYSKLEQILSTVPIKSSNKNWNCQDWVKDALHILEKEGTINKTDCDRGVEKLLDAISRPFMEKTPNAKAAQGP